MSIVMSNPTKSLIVVDGIGSTVTAELSDEYVKLRDSTLEKTATIIKVDSQEEAQTATDIANVGRGFVSIIEEERESRKKPLLTAERLLDSVAKKGKKVVQDEIDRIEKLVGDFKLKEIQAENQRRADERKRQLEFQQEQERLQREAAQAAQAAAQAKNKAAREAAEAEQRRIQREALAAQIAAAEVEEFVPKAPEAIKGAALKLDWEIEITDLHALYAYNHDAVKLEAKLSVVRKMIEADSETEIPGVKFKQILNSIGRANQSQIALS